MSDALQSPHVVPAGRGLALTLSAGQRARIVNTHGTQVVDTWAFVQRGPEEFLSLEHCREVRQKILFDVGDRLVTNRYRPILTIVADTSPGEHDTLIAACSRPMFAMLGRGDDHPNCTDNLQTALAGLCLRSTVTPSPWNLFMSAPVYGSRTIGFRRPICRAGDYVELRADLDCILVLSACPDDVYPTNGGDGTPVDVHVLIFPARV
jgi:uncharacterized protein YcgI (DUF1989 family)